MATPSAALAPVWARLEDLETRYAFQEEALRQLDEVVRELADQVARLESDNEVLRARLQELGGEVETPTDPAEDRPPHY